MKLLLAWLAAVAPLAAQETPVFRSETALKLVRFHVAQKGRYVQTLRPGDVVLLEDGKPRPFTVFESALTGRRTVPVELAAVFDTSGSVMNDGLLNPLVFKATVLEGLDNVRIAVYGFGEKLRRYCPPTGDFDTLRAALIAVRERPPKQGVDVPITLPPKRRADPRGSTWIYESVIGVATDLSAQPSVASRMMVVFSDGLANTTATPDDASAVCQEHGVAVYPVVLGHWRLAEQMRKEEERLASRKGPSPLPSATAERLNAQDNQVQEFARLARLTGGHAFDPPSVDLDVLRRVLAGIVAEARTAYLVGFKPDGRPHKWQVRLRDKSLGQVIQ